MLSKNEIIGLRIESVSNDGGVGRHNGMAVFVPMTAPGDFIEAKIVKVKKTHAFGIISKITLPSQDRVENSCPVYKRCGGCVLRHIGYDRELEIKTAWVAESLNRIGGVDVELDETLPSPRESRYRNKAQYPVRMVDGKIRAGFFARRSHDIIPVSDCLLQPEVFAKIVEKVILYLEEFQIKPYDELNHTGIVRHIFLRLAEATGEVMLCLVINAPKLPRGDKLVQRINSDCPEVTTFVVNENRLKTNVIFGGKTHVLHGSGYVTDELCGVRVRLSARSFYQVNRESAKRLYKAALEYAAPSAGDILLDLYCGAGTIGLSMAYGVRQIIGVEIVDAAVRDAEQNATQNGITNARFIRADAAEAAKTLKNEGVKPDIVVVDPPRKGLDDSLPEIIAGISPRKLIYISCNPATLARDSARLKDLGYKMARVRAVDLFPRTGHVECVALFSRG